MSGKILVVEDNDRNRRLMRILLKANGYEVIEAPTGTDAMDYLKDHVPDLILMDIQLPHTDGLALTREIKNGVQTKDIPIIAVTAYAMKGDRERMLAAGCDGYVSKPIDTRKLPRTIADALQKRDQTKKGTGMSKIKTLLITGLNNHDWERSAPYCKDLLEKSGKFEVTLTEDPETLMEDAGAIADYQLLFCDYNKSPGWSETAKANFEAAVRNGTGLVILHASDNAFTGWVEYEKMVGLL